MQRSLFSLALLGSLVVLSPFAEAQRPGAGRGGAPGQGGRGGAPGAFGGFAGGRGGAAMDVAALLGIEQVQKEIGLEGAKLEAVKEVIAAQREKQRNLFTGGQNLRELSEEARATAMAEMREKRQALSKETEEALSQHLTAAQKSRVDQIQLQLRGIRALDDADVVAKLELNEVQQLEISEILEQQGTAMRELTQRGRDAGREGFAQIRERTEALQKSTEEKVMAVLTQPQRTKFNELKGAPFALDRAALMQGFGGARGGQPGARGEGGERPPRRQRPATE